MKLMLMINQKPKWGNWKEEKDCTPQEKGEANLITLDNNEAVLDSESKEHAKKLSKQLCKDKISHERWNSGSRGEHFHITINGFEKLNEDDRKAYREELIKKYRCDVAKKTGVIAKKNKPHFKTGRKKTIIEKKEFGINYLDLNLLQKIKVVKKYDHKTKSDEIIEQIKQKIKVPDLMKEYGFDTTKNPTECLWHTSESKKNFSYNEELWHCFNCGKGGDIITLVMIHENYDFIKTKDKLMEIAGIKKKKEKKIVSITDGTIIKLDGYIENVERFYKTHSFFYDKSNMYWIWNDIEKRYTMVDDVDMMNLLDNVLGFDGQTVSSSLKSNYLEAFKRVGRNHIPKNPPKRWIQFKDKAVSLRSGNVYDVTPDYFFTNPIPWKIGETDKTPTMDKLITEWVGGEYKPTIYELIGYACLSDYPIHLIFCFVGSGRNGKSKCIEMINKFMGIENVCSTELDLLLGSRFESFKLYKKLVCCMGETNFGIINKTSLLKKLTGQDLIGFEFKNKKPFDDYNYAKIIISSNSLPTTDDTSEGFYRRWLIIDFPNTFPEGKDILQTIPKQEYEALANKVSKILPKLLDQAEFTNQGTIETRKIKYTLASNPLSFFIQTACSKDHNSFMRYSELYASYQLYLSKTKKRAISYKEFSKNLAMEGIEIQRTTKQIGGEYVSDRFILGLNMKKNWQKECLMSDMPDMTTISLKFPICKNEWKSSHNRHIRHNQPNTDQLLSFVQETQERNKKGYDMQTFANKYGDTIMQHLLQSGEVYERHSGFLWRLD